MVRWQHIVDRLRDYFQRQVVCPLIDDGTLCDRPGKKIEEKVLYLFLFAMENGFSFK